MSEVELLPSRSRSRHLTGIQIIGTGCYLPDNIVTFPAGDIRDEPGTARIVFEARIIERKGIHFVSFCAQCLGNVIVLRK